MIYRYEFSPTAKVLNRIASLALPSLRRELRVREVKSEIANEDMPTEKKLMKRSKDDLASGFMTLRIANRNLRLERLTLAHSCNLRREALIFAIVIIVMQAAYIIYKAIGV